MLASSGEITAPGACPGGGRGRPDLSRCHLPVLRHPGLQPFADQSDHPAVADTQLDELDQPIVTDRIEEPRDIGVQYPVHLSLVDPDRQRIQRIVLATPRPEPVAEPQEIFLPDRIQHFHQRALDNLVLQRRYAQRTLSAIRLRDINPSRWLRPVSTPVDTAVQVYEFVLEALAVCRPGHPSTPADAAFRSQP